jgi:hypothetical protein
MVRQDPLRAASQGICSQILTVLLHFSNFFRNLILADFFTLCQAISVQRVFGCYHAEELLSVNPADHRKYERSCAEP